MSLFVRAEKFMTFRFRGPLTRSWISHFVGELLISRQKRTTYPSFRCALRLSENRKPGKLREDMRGGGGM